jgi:hypothetical protein
MELIAPVTDYIPASILTTLNDIVVRGAADPERKAGLLRAIGIKIGHLTRNAAGDQVVSGVGFNPSVVIFLAADDTTTNKNWSVGFDDGTTADNICGSYNGTRVEYSTFGGVHIRRDATNYLYGSISAKGADGFTITWTINGACTLDFIYLALP